MRTTSWLTCMLTVAAAASLAGACGGSGSSGFQGGGADADGGDGGGTDGVAPGTPDGTPSLNLDSGLLPRDGAGPPVPIVYAHSPSELYKLDPKTKAVSVVGSFKGGCASVIDIALDQASNAYVTTMSGFYKLDLATAACTHVADGNYPNSLSFVPKGTLDPSAEALVGYFGSQYVRIDTGSGAISNIGALTGGYVSSGDIVSVVGGGTFLTVNGNGCGDCLLQVDPKTGDVVQSYGDVAHGSVFGLAFWAGTVYGFDDAGQIFTIAWQNSKLVTTDIPVPNPPAGLRFWGAGSTTAAPPKDDDGGGIPIK